MAKTRSDFIERCLINLGIIAVGQPIAAEDVAKMDKLIDPAFEMLAGLQIYYVADGGSEGPSGGAIENSAFLPLADYVANQACAAFNLPADEKMQALAQLAERNLITLSAPSRTLRTLRIDPAAQSPRFGIYKGGF